MNKYVIGGCALALCVASASSASAATRHPARPRPYTHPAYASASAASVHPGVQVITAGSQCTANFVYAAPGGQVYLGQAAHCSGTGAATSTDGCQSASLPLGTKVSIDGAKYPATMVYNSWLTMQRSHEKDANTCAYNDLALLLLDPRDVAHTNPSVPFFGGPTGLNTSGTSLGDEVYSYGNSSLRMGISALSPKLGTSLGAGSGGWTHQVYTATPGIPGDSGSGFLDAQGRAFGVLSTVEFAPMAGSNGVGDLSREVSYAQRHGFAGLRLERGTQPFSPPA